MATLGSRAGYEPGRAWAEQDPYQVGRIAPFPGVADYAVPKGRFGNLLQRQYKLRRRMEELQMRAMKEEMQRAQERFRMEKRAARPRGGLTRGPEPLLGRERREMARGEQMVRALHVPGITTPENLRRGMMMGRALGRTGVHAGLMQSGRILGGLGGQALAGGYGLAQQQAGGQMALQRQLMAQAMGAYGPEGTLAQQQELEGQRRSMGMEKGGRVPETGTYKLHQGEVVVPKKMSDVLFPYAMRGPEASKGKARKSYQAGTVGDLGWLETPAGQQVADYLARVWQRFRRPEEPPTGIEPTPAPPAMPPEPIVRERELPPTLEPPPPMLETVGEAGERKFEIRGEPETEAERRKAWREEVQKNEREAEYQRARVNLLMSYFVGKPEALQDPKVKALLSQRQFLAQQYQGMADKRQAQLEKIEQAEKQQETLKEIQRIETGGRAELGRVQGEARAREVWQRQAMDLPGTLDEIQSDFAKNQDERLYIDRMHTAFAMYIPPLAAHLGMSLEEAQQRVSEMIEQSLDSPQSLDLMIMLINNAIRGR